MLSIHWQLASIMSARKAQQTLSNAWEGILSLNIWTMHTSMKGGFGLHWDLQLRVHEVPSQCRQQISMAEF